LPDSSPGSTIGARPAGGARRLPRDLRGTRPQADQRDPELDGFPAVSPPCGKHSFNRNRRPLLSFYRDRRGLECDLLVRSGGRILAIEAKAGTTYASDWFRPLNRVARRLPEVTAKAIVYGGGEHRITRSGEVVPLSGLHDLLTRFDSQH